MKDLGELNYFLGVQVVQNHKDDKVWLGQPTFTELFSESTEWKMLNQSRLQ